MESSGSGEAIWALDEKSKLYALFPFGLASQSVYAFIIILSVQTPHAPPPSFIMGRFRLIASKILDAPCSTRS